MVDRNYPLPPYPPLGGGGRLAPVATFLASDPLSLYLDSRIVRGSDKYSKRWTLIAHLENTGSPKSMRTDRRKFRSSEGMDLLRNLLARLP